MQLKGMAAEKFAFQAFAISLESRVLKGNGQVW